MDMNTQDETLILGLLPLQPQPVCSASATVTTDVKVTSPERVTGAGPQVLNTRALTLAQSIRGQNTISTPRALAASVDSVHQAGTAKHSLHCPPQPLTTTCGQGSASPNSQWYGTEQQEPTPRCTRSGKPSPGVAQLLQAGVLTVSVSQRLSYEGGGTSPRQEPVNVTMGSHRFDG